MKLLTKPIKIASIVFLSIFMVAVYVIFFVGEDMRDCDFAPPIHSILDQKTVDNKTYYLVKTISGFQDKLEILLLFDEEPSYDSCRMIKIESIYDETIRRNKKISHIYLDILNNRLEVIYENKPYEADHNESLKIEIR